MSITAQQVAAGQAVYGKRVLRTYDFFVLGLSNRFIWRCPTLRLRAHYDRHITANHLDVGVGTGYFLDHCRFPSAAPRVALLDLNPNTLEFAGRRIARYRPEIYQRDIFLPLGIDAPRFDSVALNYVLHCVPGSMRTKGEIFDHLRAVMNPGAVLFGSTLLRSGVPLGPLGRRLMSLYNRKGIFSNEWDTLAGLDRELGGRFSETSVHRVGCAALFYARA